MHILYTTNLSDESINSIYQTLPLFESSPDFKATIVNPFGTKYQVSDIPILKSKYPIIHEYQLSYDKASMPLKELNNIVSDEEMKEFKQELSDKFPWAADKVGIRSKFGESPVVIGTSVLSFKPDLVIISIGESDLEEDISESVLFYFMNNTNYPLLLVPEGAKVESIDNITMLYNYEIDTDYSAIDKLTSMVGAKLNVVNITDEILDLSQNKNETPKLSVVSEFRKIESQDSKDTLRKYIVSQDLDMLTLASRRKHFFDRMFDTETAKSILVDKKIPVLCLPEEVMHGLF